MRRGESVPASTRAERSRQATKYVTARELLYAGVLARLWPSYITTPIEPRRNPSFPWLLCVETPAGLLVWRLTDDEVVFFDYVTRKDNDGRKSENKEGTLYALASEGW